MSSKKKVPKASSNTEEEDDEKLRLAVDPHFGVNGVQGTSYRMKNEHEQKPAGEAESSREEWYAGHYVHPLKLSEESKDFVFKKLTEALGEQLKEKKRKIPVCEPDNTGGIYLFHASPEVITEQDLINAAHSGGRKRLQQKKKKRKRTSSSDSDSSDDEAKIRAAAVSADWVLNKNTV